MQDAIQQHLENAEHVAHEGSSFLTRDLGDHRPSRGALVAIAAGMACT